MSELPISGTEKEKAWVSELMAAQNEGRNPNPELAPEFRKSKKSPQAAAPQAAPISAEGDAEAFTAADLTGEDVKRCRRFPMPNGKHLFIFPLSESELRTLAFWSRRINVKIEANDTEQIRASKIQQAEKELFGFQVVLCCYQDEGRTKRCFKDTDAEKVLTTLRGTLVERIVQISNEVGGEGIDLGFGDLQAFFGRALGCLNDWLLASDGWEDCPADLKIRTRDLILPLPLLK